MTYPETIEFLYSRLPMFTRVGGVAIKKGLDNILAFSEVLEHPHKRFRTIHVAGTNGKGSVSHMLAAILQEAGYKTGLYTSPHLKDFRERIRVNGKMMEESAVTAFVNDHINAIQDIQPSFFEVTVAMAFNYFAHQQVDVAVIEVGLGGRLDSTNIIHPDLSVITNIGFDHVDLLGNTLREIAVEKAGIIKNHVPVVVGEYVEETKAVFETQAERHHTTVRYAEDEVILDNISRKNGKLAVSARLEGEEFQLELDLSGSYQSKNLRTVLVAVDELKKLGYRISSQHLASALQRVKELTGLMGRWHTLSNKPLVICDTGHNEDGIREVIRNIEQTPYQKLHMVIGMVKDKDISTILNMLPKTAQYYFCQPRLDRAKPADELVIEANDAGLRGQSYPSVKDALNAAKAQADMADLVFIGGSTFVVAEVV